MSKPDTFVLMGEEQGDYNDFYQRLFTPLAVASSQAELEAFWEALPEDPEKAGMRLFDEDESYIDHHIKRVKTL